MARAQGKAVETAESDYSGLDDDDLDEWAVDKTKEEFDSDFELPEEGPYTLRLVRKSKDVPMDPKYDKTGEKRRARFEFEIVGDEDFEGMTVSMFYTISLNDRSALKPVVTALLGRELLPHERMGWQDDPSRNIVGIGNKLMQCTITHVTKNDRTFAVINGPVALRKRKNRPVAEIPETVATKTKASAKATAKKPKAAPVIEEEDDEEEDEEVVVAPPKRKAAPKKIVPVVEEDDEDEDEDDEEEEVVVAPPKRRATAKKPAPKRKAPVVEEDDEDEDEDDEDEPDF